VKGNASSAAGATGQGGLLVIEGDAGTRCGISMKGIDIVVGGSVGAMSAFMAQSGHMVVCGDTGASFGDSIYEVKLYVQGKVESLGADCIEKKMTQEHVERLQRLLDRAGVKADAKKFRRYGSARKLYNFHVDHADAY
jgi:glutamate synthase domain-containing protein 3